MFRIFCLVLFSAVGALTSRGQEKGTLRGTVSDDTETLIGASVIMLEDASIGAATDIDGNYLFSLPAGAHNIVCSFTGMRPDTVKVVIKPGQTTVQNFFLEQFAEELGVVVVSAGKFEQKLEELTVSMDVLKPDIIQSKNTTNITSALEQVPGLTIMDEEPQIRSGSGYSFGLGSRVAVLVDDLPVMTGDLGKAEWSFIPTENVEQIEVIKGASSVLYGSSALSGVINVRTAYPKDKPLTKVNLYTGFRSAILEDDAPAGKRFANFFGLDASMANGKKWWDGVANFSGMNFLHSRKIKQLDLVIGGNFHYDYGYIGPQPSMSTIQGLSSNPVQQFIMLRGAGYIDILTGDTVPEIAPDEVREIRGRFNFNLRYRNKKVKGLAYGLNGNFMRSSKNFSLVWNNKGAATHSYVVPAGVDSTAYTRALYNNSDGLYRAYPGTMTLTEITTFYFDPFINYVTPRGIQHTLRSRILYSDNDNSNNQSNRSTTIFGEYQIQRTFEKMYNLSLAAGASGSYSMSQSEVFVGGDTTGNNDMKNFSLYMQLDKKFWKVLNLSLGVRGEYYQINDTEFAVKPVFRSGVSFKMGRETYVRYSYGQGYRFPTIAEKFIKTTSGGFGVFPNPNLQPETSWNMEIGFKQGFKVGKFFGYLDFVGFWQHFNNSIEFVMIQSENIPGLKFYNTGSNRVRGVEVSLMGTGQFTKSVGMNIIAGYTFTVPESINPEQIYTTDSVQIISLGDTTWQPLQLSHYGTSVSDTKILKYRFQHLASLDIELTYRKWALGYSFRYYSKVRNLDRVVYELDASNQFNTGIIQYREDEEVPGSPADDYKLNNVAGGTYVMDARVSFQVAEWLKAAFIVNNFLNNSYSLRPLKMEQPRTASIQFTVKV